MIRKVVGALVGQRIARRLGIRSYSGTATVVASVIARDLSSRTGRKLSDAIEAKKYYDRLQGKRHPEPKPKAKRKPKSKPGTSPTRS